MPLCRIEVKGRFYPEGAEKNYQVYYNTIKSSSRAHAQQQASWLPTATGLVLYLRFSFLKQAIPAAKDQELSAAMGKV